MTEQPRYLLDADSFIRSKRQHYAFDFCPGYWDALLQGFRQKRVISIVPIRKELERGNDALTDWVKGKVPKRFFDPVTDETVQAAYAAVIRWVEKGDRFSPAARQKFASGADPWLVAYARTNGYNLVTYEVSSPELRARIKLPDVAHHFKVKCLPPYVMLRRMHVILELAKQRKRR